MRNIEAEGLYMDTKMIVTDLDGTLLRIDKTSILIGNPLSGLRMPAGNFL